MTRKNELLLNVDKNGAFELPKAMMTRHGWEPGTRLLLEEVPDGLRLKSVPAGCGGEAA